MQTRLARIFKTKTREEWTAIMEQTDICFAPVLRMSEAMRHKHNVHRGSFVEIEGIEQPGPAPRFLGTPSRVQRPPARVGEHTDAILETGDFRPTRSPRCTRPERSHRPARAAERTETPRMTETASLLMLVGAATPPEGSPPRSMPPPRRRAPGTPASRSIL